MLHSNGPVGRTPFTETEFAALQALRARHKTRSALFTDRDPSLFRFLHWLIRQAVWCCPVEFLAAHIQQNRPSLEPTLDAWVYRLKEACDAGYYRTEVAEGHQTGFPWQNKACRDCPFWSNNYCQVWEGYRWPTTHTCTYFDPWNREAGYDVIQHRHENLLRRWWDWFRAPDS